MSHTYVIAEAGSCHDGQLELAKDMVDVASGLGADAVKFQYWSSPARMVERRHAPQHRAMYTRYRMPQEWIETLANVAASVRIDFMCTTYLPEDITAVAPYVKHFKIASFEAQDHKFVRAHPGPPQDVFISTGLCSTRDLDRLRRTYWSAKLLHCVSAYPTPLNELNLAVIRAYHLDGFSDHSGDVAVGGMAVCAGAQIIEVHFRHPSTLADSPDAGSHALWPSELRGYITRIREAESIMGDSLRRIQPSEYPLRAHQVLS